MPPPAPLLSVGTPLPSRATAALPLCHTALPGLTWSLCHQTSHHRLMDMAQRWPTLTGQQRQRNKTGTASEEPAAENSCQTNVENLKKSTSVLEQRLPLNTGEETQTTPVLLSASDPGQPQPSGQERQTDRKRFFHNAPLVCQVRRRCQNQQE